MRRRGHRRIVLAALLAALAGPTGCGGPGPPRPEPPGPETPSDVVAFVGSSCVACHRAGGPAPFALESAGTLARRGRAVVNALRSGFMPPWLPADGDVPFANDRRARPDQIERVAAWLAGDPDTADSTPIPGPPGATIDRDLVVAPDAPIEFAASRHARLVEFAGTAPAGGPARLDGAALLDTSGRVGHALVHIESAERAAQPALHLSPATGPWRAADGTAWRVGPGDAIVVRLYLPPSPRAFTLTPEVALSFRDGTDVIELSALRIEAESIRLPRRAPAVSLERSTVLASDMTLVELLPDAHLLCRSIVVRAERPDGSALVLLDVPGWDLAWQEAYRPATPVPLPAGTRISTTWTWDNSRANPRNPHDPLVDVRDGPTLGDARGVVWLSLRPGLY